MIENPSQNPPPGWYPDPQSPQMLRWWNGGEWTNDIRPATSIPPATPGEGEMRPVSDWMTETFRLMISNAGSLFTLAVILLVPAALVSALGLWFGIKDLLIIIDNEATANPFSVEGADSLGIAGLGLVANLVLTFLFSVCAARLAMSGRFEPAIGWAEGLTSGLRRFLPAIGWTLFAGLIVVMIFAAVITVSVLLGPIGGLFGVLVLLVLFVVGYGRYAMVFTIPYVAGAGHRNPLSAHRVTAGHTGGLIGRTFLLVLITLTVSLAGSFITGPVAALGGAEPVSSEDTVIRLADFLGGNLGLFLLTTLVNSIIGGVASLVWHVGQANLFEDLGGVIDPELRNHGKGRTPAPASVAPM